MAASAPTKNYPGGKSKPKPSKPSDKKSGKK